MTNARASALEDLTRIHITCQVIYWFVGGLYSAADKKRTSIDGYIMSVLPYQTPAQYVPATVQ